MGGRLSKPSGPDGTTESSVPAKLSASPSSRPPFSRGRINARTIVAPAAAFTMAILLFVYASTSIRAAKANAQRHRNADTGGGGIDLLKEHRRRHGLGRRIDGGGSTVVELVKEVKSDIVGQKRESGRDDESEMVENDVDAQEDVLKKAMKGKRVR